ncbi:unnamed protein product [Medioppia subpectinata]|uniref:Major facilitator superfamily (MFS) profile domain-containing protein n=1 Tax=Medioppia subpectinata TaxID=1979941 RepID=A0A7R9KUV3_9ACAR|nr:unnamed protein product [Medioppia subpectinata]CAG2109090.1 unnamed protein product [Medioppia subpectinata]
MMLECCGPKHRGDVVMLGSIGWVLGYATIPGLAYWLQDYRYMSYASLIAIGLMAFWYYFMFESPRWLITNGHIDKAEAVLRRALQMNGKPDDQLKTQLTQLSAYLQQSQLNEKSKRNHTVIDLVKTPKLRKISLIMWYCYPIHALVYYGLSYNISDFGGNFYVTFLLSGLVGLPSHLIPVPLLRYVGRKKLFAGFMLLTGLSCFAVIPSDREWLTVMFALIGKFGDNTSWNVMSIIAPELYPTVLRQTGMGVSSVIGRLGAISGPFMKDLASNYGLSLVMSLYGILMCLGSLLALFLPETKDREIPDTIAEAENKAFHTKQNFRNNNQVYLHIKAKVAEIENASAANRELIVKANQLLEFHHIAHEDLFAAAVAYGVDTNVADVSGTSESGTSKDPSDAVVLIKTNEADDHLPELDRVGALGKVRSRNALQIGLEKYRGVVPDIISGDFASRSDDTEDIASDDKVKTRAKRMDRKQSKDKLRVDRRVESCVAVKSTSGQVFGQQSYRTVKL